MTEGETPRALFCVQDERPLCRSSSHRRRDLQRPLGWAHACRQCETAATVPARQPAPIGLSDQSSATGERGDPSRLTSQVKGIPPGCRMVRRHSCRSDITRIMGAFIESGPELGKARRGSLSLVQGFDATCSREKSRPHGSRFVPRNLRLGSVVPSLARTTVSGQPLRTARRSTGFRRDHSPRRTASLRHDVMCWDAGRRRAAGALRRGSSRGRPCSRWR